MSENGRHRRENRKRGVRLRRSQGRRRTSGAVVAPTADEMRSEARDARARSARRRVTLATVGAAALFFGTVVGAAFWSNRQSDDAPAVSVEAPTEEGSSVLVVVAGDDGSAASVALVAAAETTPRVVLFHPALLTTLPGFGENTLSHAGRFNGGELVELAVANLLGARIDTRIDLDATSVAALVSEGLTVDVPIPLVVADGDAQRVAVGVGPAHHDPATVAALLLEQGVDDQLALLQRQGAAWQALLDAMAADSALVGRLSSQATTSPAAAATALSAAAHADRTVVTAVPATSLEPTGGVERYQLDGAVADAFVAEAIPYLFLAEAPRVRVEVLNGNGQIGATRPVAAGLIRRGYRVVRTDNADTPNHEVTRIVAQGREHQADALAVREILGLGDVSLEARQPSGVVDLTIIVGQDLPGQDSNG